MNQLETVLTQGKEALKQADSLESLQDIRNQYLSKKGEVSALLGQLKELPNEKKKEFGQLVNQVKDELNKTYQQQLEKLSLAALEANLEKEKINIELPGVQFASAHLHPLTIVQQEIEDLFVSLGYEVVEGPEVELDFYNFERANIPANHPARDMQDTFYIDETTLLRTHTTAIQTRALEANAHKEVLKVICPGKVYRKDDDDATHSH